MFNYRSYRNSSVLVKTRRIHKLFYISFCTLKQAFSSHWLCKILLHFGLDFILYKLQLLFLDELKERFDLLNVECDHKELDKPSHLSLSYLKFIC
jgi:hypothetical protein